MPISKDEIIKIYNKMIKYVFGIQIIHGTNIKNSSKPFYARGTGFFAKIPFNYKMLHVLITDSRQLILFILKKIE